MSQVLQTASSEPVQFNFEAPQNISGAAIGRLFVESNTLDQARIIALAIENAQATPLSRLAIDVFDDLDAVQRTGNERGKHHRQDSEHRIGKLMLSKKGGAWKCESFQSFAGILPDEPAPYVTVVS